MKVIDWIEAINRRGYCVKVVNGGSKLMVYRRKEIDLLGDKAIPFGIVPIWSFALTWKLPQ